MTCSALSRLAASLALCAALAAPARGADEAAPRSAGLSRAWGDPQAVRTVYFVHGMSCRACTMLLDRQLASMDGIHWARFNFPLRLLVAYHDPRRVSTEALRGLVSQAELRAEVIASRPASGYRPDARTMVAVWKGGTLPLGEARRLPDRFQATLKRNLLEPGDPEYDQVIGEIVAEEVRRRIFAERARAAGFATGPPETALPPMLAREFYYPSDALRPTPIEAGIALFLNEKVLLGDEGKEGRARFDAWLRALWHEAGLDYRPEYLEAAPLAGTRVK